MITDLALGWLVGKQIIDKEEIAKQNMLGPLKREITITKRLSHPNIVNLKEVMATKDKVYIFLELVPGGELFDKIVADGPLKVTPHVSRGNGHGAWPCALGICEGW